MKRFKKLLKKKMVEPEETPDLPRHVQFELSLYQQAKKRLGIKHLSLSYLAKEWLDKSRVARLTQLLSAENIPVFIAVSVEQYQEKVSQSGWQNKARRTQRKKKNRQALFFILLLFAGLILVRISNLIFPVAKTALIITVLAFILAIFGLIGSLISLLRKPVYCYWQRLPIAEYNNTIPLAILKTALRLKEKLPGITFWLERFTCDGRKHCSDVQLFLIAIYGDKEYYLAVESETET